MNTLEAQTLTLTLMDKHGLLNEGWSFSFDRAKRRYGATHWKNKTITLSTELVELNTVEQTTDTILHEIAHALAGPRNGHNYKWRMQCVKVGAKPVRCYSSSEVVQPPHKWVGTCPGCSRETKRIKRMKVACATCCTKYNHGRFSSEFLFVWTPNLEEVKA